jgi:hypothetical protein
MRFRLTTVAYVFALLAAGMAVFGGWGVIAALGLVVFWAAAFQHPRPLTCLEWAVISGIVLLLIGLLLPAVQSARESARVNTCQNNLKQFGLALTVYMNERGSLPAASTFDNQGTPLHSWRTAILPYMEQSMLLQRIRLDEPWNSPANSSLLGTIAAPYPYQCPSHQGGTASTDYFAVVGEHTAWPSGRGRTKAEFQDNLSSTILVIEAPHRRVHWAEPADMTFDEAVKFLTEPLADRIMLHELDRGFFTKPGWIINAVFADAQVRQLALPLPRDVAVALLTADGSEAIDETKVMALGEAELDYGKIYAFAGVCSVGDAARVSVDSAAASNG